MDTAPYLPNDLLRTMPFSETVGTWPLNDTYLNIIQSLEGLWRQHGYNWRFGTEINFRIAEAPTVQKTMAKDAKFFGMKSRASYDRLNRYQQGDMNPFFAAQAALPDSDGPFLAAIAAVEETLEIQRRRIGYQPPHLRAKFETNEREAQRIFKSYLHSDRTRRDHSKRANVFLAWLHIMPSACGGIADMVDMRFGNERHGRGWWDCGDDIELRFFNRGAFDIIQSYNRASFLFFEACKRFGFIPRIRNNLSQLHFSVWDKEERNLMVTENESALDIRSKMTDGLMTACTFLPFMYMGSASDSDAIVADISAGPTRLNAIRFCEDSWELRRFYPDTLVHLAQDVAFTLIGSSSMVFSGVTPQTPNAGFVLKNPESLDFEYVDVKPFRHLRIKDNSDRKCAAIKSCLEAAHIKEDGSLDVPMETLYHNHELLVSEIGRGSVDYYTIVEDGYVLNLGDIEYARVWQSLFSKIKYDAHRNVLDVSRLPKPVQAWFEPFEVHAVRTDFSQEGQVVLVPEYVHRLASHFESGDCRINHVSVDDTMRVGNFFRTYIAREKAKRNARDYVGAASFEKSIILNAEEFDMWHGTILSNLIVPNAAFAGRLKADGIKDVGVSDYLQTANAEYLAEVAAYREADTYPETKASSLFQAERDLYADRQRCFDLTKLTEALTRITASHQRFSDLTLDGESGDQWVVEYIIHFCAFLKKDHQAACKEALCLRDHWMDEVKKEISKKQAFEAKEKAENAQGWRNLPTPDISESTYMFIDAAVRKACDALPAMSAECEAWAKKLPDALEVPLVVREQQAITSIVPATPSALRI